MEGTADLAVEPPAVDITTPLYVTFEFVHLVKFRRPWTEWRAVDNRPSRWQRRVVQLRSRGLGDEWGQVELWDVPPP